MAIDLMDKTGRHRYTGDLYPRAIRYSKLYCVQTPANLWANALGIVFYTSGNVPLSSQAAFPSILARPLGTSGESL